jgi:hypothetical protein
MLYCLWFEDGGVRWVQMGEARCNRKIQCLDLALKRGAMSYLRYDPHLIVSMFLTARKQQISEIKIDCKRKEERDMKEQIC